MLKIYNTDIATNKLEEVDEIKKGCWINLVNPSSEEINRVCKEVKIEEEFIKYPLDYDEKARIDTEEEAILFIIDIPVIEQTKKEKIYATMPLRNDCSKR